MESETAEKSPVRRRRWVLALVFVVVAIGFAVNFLTDSGPPSTSGLPLRRPVGTNGWDAWVRAARAAAVNNAAPIIDEALAVEVGYTEDDREFTFRGYDSVLLDYPRHHPALHQWLGDTTEVLRHLDNALAQPVLHDARAFDELLRHVVDLGRWLSLYVDLAAVNGRTGDARAGIERLFRLGDSVQRNQRNLLYMIVSERPRREALEASRVLLRREGPRTTGDLGEVDDLEALARLLAAHRPRAEDFRNSILGEFHFLAENASRVAEEQDGWHDLEVVPDSLDDSPNLVRMLFLKENRTLRYQWAELRRCAGSWSDPEFPPQGHSTLRVVGAWLNGNRGGLELIEDLRDSLRTALGQRRDYRARHAGTELAVALRLFELEHGVLPASLAELGGDPERTVDLITGETFRYEPTERRLLIGETAAFEEDDDLNAIDL